MKTLILIDRDGVLIYDKKYYLGSQRNWKKKIKILPGVIKGLKLLNSLLDVHVYLITNQPGVAVKDFPLLTITKAKEVNKYVLNLFAKKGAVIEDAFFCPHASPEYVKKRSQYKFDKKLVHKCNCLKPNPDMIKGVLEQENATFKNTKIYVIGDRTSDIQTALNVKGTGILVPFVNEPGQIEKVKKMKGKIYIAKNFLKAAEYIVKKVYKN